MILSWGKPRIFLKKIGSSTAAIIELFTPVEDSTQLSTTKGDKKEAKIEGGENEAVKYSKNTYALSAAIRLGFDGTANRKKPIEDSDGVIEGEYELYLQPEDPKAPGLHMRRCTVSVEDSYTAADGVTLTYTFDAVKDGSYDQIEWGTVTVTPTTGTPTSVSFTEDTEPTTANS